MLQGGMKLISAILAALSAALLCTIIIWVIREMLLCPVKAGKSTVQQLVIRIYGEEPALEQHLKGLVWLNEARIFRCEIVLCGTGLDGQTRSVARIFEQEYDFISFYEDEEVTEWIRNTSFWN